MKICSFRVLVEPDPIEKMMGRFEIARTRDNQRREEAAQTVGTILQVGKTAWKGYDDGEAWAEVGDRILYTRYGGRYITNNDDPDNNLIIIDDENVLAVLEDGEEYKN